PGPRRLTMTATTRIALGLEYDGSRYHGWQSQVGLPTVQDALEAAIATVAGIARLAGEPAPIRVHCAGRTDTGVHALLQVVHSDAAAARPQSAWVRGVNALLPEGIAVRWAREVPESFHARYLAQARRYRYLLLNRPERPGLLAGRVGWYHRRLDEAAIAAA